MRSGKDRALGACRFIDGDEGRLAVDASGGYYQWVGSWTKASRHEKVHLIEPGIARSQPGVQGLQDDLAHADLHRRGNGREAGCGMTIAQLPHGAQTGEINRDGAARDRWIAARIGTGSE